MPSKDFEGAAGNVNVAGGGVGRILSGVNKYAATFAAVAAIVAAVAGIVSIFVIYWRTARLETSINGATTETRVLGSTIFSLITEIHPAYANKVLQIENEMSIHVKRIGVLRRPVQDKEIFIVRSKVDPNKWAFRLPSQPKGTSRSVYAIRRGKVEADGIGKDERGLVALRTSDENGYLIEYDHLTRLAPGIAQGREFEEGHLLGFVEAASEPCLRIGLKTPQGHYLDPRAFFSPPIPNWVQ